MLAWVAAITIAGIGAVSASTQALLGAWARDDGQVRVSVAPCGARFCMTNTSVSPGNTKDKVGDRVEFDLRGDAGAMKGSAYYAEQKSPKIAETLAPQDPTKAAKLPDVHIVGQTLFTGYNLPLQILGVLLLVSTVGVVVLSKRQTT